MKKISILLSLIALTVCAEAQTFIPKAGISLSKLAADGEDSEEFEPKNKIGFTIGVGYNIELSDVISLQPELNFIQKGFRIDESLEEDGYEVSVKSKLTMNYIEIPLLVKATFGESTKFFFSAGPSLGIGMGGKMKTEASVNYMGTSFSETSEGKVHFGDEPENPEENEVYIPERLDIGLQVGAGVIIIEKIMIDVRYGYGLTNLNGDDTDGSSYNRAFQFTVGVPLSLKK